ncbi:peptidoglycan D,D-transpeptidase FtsI family protein [Cryobacterium psychrophilum]|uniref:Penicillin-binding protein 2 n=1 Tax=Cryobacterium psychrophilum TaxID=41988 RepID=A0A4Y8KP28_9MICO|nr:penicillin-binding transpeptidase domain-containing protein [Cryobacterium psychrophilum]TDW30230.1 cell elongation-specific peptidoglycan D,D-transpeptidase [Cryobacterium psychrophilum]TFD77455.1 penicillin-binding protein 2 [Cryobacterium psychrophilum]
MNRELKRVSVVVLLMFVALLSSTSIVQAFQADNLSADARNTRTLLDSYSVERGAILVNGEPVAQSIPVDDAFKFLRTYSNGPLYAPLTGFIPINGAPTGLEHALNGELTGTSNAQFFDKVSALVTGVDPKGAAVETTIDPIAQQAAWDALGDKTGSVVMLEPKTGRILAMVSKPSFDPNLLSVHNNADVTNSYQELLNDAGNPLINRAINSLNPPGSVFKLVVVTAALESGKFTAESTFPNPGTFQLPGSSSIVTNSGGGTCGEGDTVTIANALRLSCNIPMAELGLQLGDEAIRETAEKFGFNDTFSTPLRATKSNYPQTLDKAQTALSSFGQTNVRATPLQMAVVSAAIANGGVAMKPNMVEEILAPDLSPLQSFEPEVLRRVMSTETAASLTAMMVNNVQDGAASNARIDGVKVAGKTGTAENGSTEPYTLWFTGFAPANDAKHAITVLIEDGGGMGQTGFGNLLAAPIAQKVLGAVLNK